MSKQGQLTKSYRQLLVGCPCIIHIVGVSSGHKVARLHSTRQMLVMVMTASIFQRNCLRSCQKSEDQGV